MRHSHHLTEAIVKAYQKLLLIFFVTLSLSAIAEDGREEGGVSGGGGNAVVCMENGEVISVELLDLYEDRRGKNIAYMDLSGDMKIDMSKLIAKLYPEVRTNEYTNVLAADFIAIMLNLKDISPDDVLADTGDVLAATKPANENCKIKPVINFYSRDHILVDRKLFNKMNYVNQLALILHELLYLKERENGVSDSRYVRKIVGQALRQENMVNLQDAMYNDAILRCETIGEEAKSIFTITKKRSYYMSATAINSIFFEQLNGHNLILFTGFDYQLPEDNADFVIKNPFLYKYLITPMEIDLIRKEGKMYLSYRGEKNDSFSKREVICR